jgi:hypothetical protein
MTKDELVALIKKNPISIACGVVVVAVGLGFYFRSGDISAAEALLAEKSAQAEKYSLNIKYSAQLKEQFETLTLANRNVDGRLMRASQQGVNTQYFYKLERETGVKLMSFGQSPTSPPAKGSKAAYVPVTFNVAVQGTMAQVLDFLRQLEGGTHFVRTLTASCNTNAATRQGPLTLNLSVQMLGLP